MTDKLATVDEPRSVNTLTARTPEGLVENATGIAKALSQVIRQQGLSKKIQGRDFVSCEGWTTLGAMNGVVPVEVSNTCDAEGVYTSRVELRRINDGAVVGGASAECGAKDEVDRRGEPIWANRPSYARRSMAATRATSKAFRLSFSWIMVLSGHEATPAEEMENIIDVPPTAPSPRQQAAPAQPSNGDEVLMPVGKEKGKPIKGFKTRGLEWWVNKLGENIADPGFQYDKEQAKYDLEIIQAELARRGGQQTIPAGEQVADNDCPF